ncbi:MAG TPA: hypothetical protein VES01_06925 [Dermatophilaceae bacterium]|nr:hypothetical protein [Dermatophilaceae bacterium]
MSARRASHDVAALPWAGPERRYDIVREFVIALVVMGVLATILAAAFSSPDEKALTFKGWGVDAPDNLYAVTVGQLAGTTESAGYGPPYNNASEGVAVGPLKPQQWIGVRIPVDAANDFVITPLKTQEQPAAVTTALQAWDAATPDQRTAWATALDDAVQATADDDGAVHPDQVASGDYGPVPALATGLVAMAASGALDGAMLSRGEFYSSDATKQILFLGDGSYLDDAATAQNLQGNTWGMMNGINSYPGQPWLWWSSLWYQIPLFDPAENATMTTSLQDNADAWVFYIIAVIGLVAIFLPYIPGLRSIPRWIPVHRLIWRTYYRTHGNDHLV